MRLDDRHTIEVDAAPDAVWEAIPHGLRTVMPDLLTHAIARVLGCRDIDWSGTFLDVGSTIPGFRVTDSEPPRRLVLEGEHRFSRYQLTFELVGAGAGTQLSAVTAATFPGPMGAAYRLGVLTVFHGPAARRMLRAIASAAQAS